MSDIIGIGSNSRTKLVRINRDQMIEQTTFFDDNALQQNARIRSSGMLENGVSRLHDESGSDYRAVISCPSVEQWSLFKSQNPGTYEDLMSANETIRMKAVKQISLLEPAWILQLRL